MVVNGEKKEPLFAGLMVVNGKKKRLFAGLMVRKQLFGWLMVVNGEKTVVCWVNGGYW